MDRALCLVVLLAAAVGVAGQCNDNDAKVSSDSKGTVPSCFVGKTMGLCDEEIAALLTTLKVPPGWFSGLCCNTCGAQAALTGCEKASCEKTKAAGDREAVDLDKSRWATDEA